MKKSISIYHYLWAYCAALWYHFPAKNFFIIGVTGTKGKSTVVDIIAAILAEAGKKSVISSTVHFSIAGKSERNLTKMSMPGKGFLQRLLAQGLKERCTHAVIEMTSEGARQHRHRFIPLDVLVVTNISPEHIESHGSYENYLAAKVSIAQELERSTKPHRTIIVNRDDKEKLPFLSLSIPQKIEVGAKDAFPYSTRLPGEMNRFNILIAAAAARTVGISEEIIATAIQKFHGVRGRMERIENNRGITIYVDYAHTRDSLRAAYEAAGKGPKLCVLGSCGGGRDAWKRPVMAQAAHEYCEKIIFTNEDPYDEDPEAIINDMSSALPHDASRSILDRREAIRTALREARHGDIVMITGKGTDPYIMGPRGTKIPWDDAAVVREELKALEKLG